MASFFFASRAAGLACAPGPSPISSPLASNHERRCFRFVYDTGSEPTVSQTPGSPISQRPGKALTGRELSGRLGSGSEPPALHCRSGPPSVADIQAEVGSPSQRVVVARQRHVTVAARRRGTDDGRLRIEQVVDAAAQLQTIVDPV